MQFRYGRHEMVLLPLSSGQFRVVVNQDGNAVAYEDAPTEFRAYIAGLYMISRLSGIKFATLIASLGPLGLMGGVAGVSPEAATAFLGPTPSRSKPASA